MGMQDNKIFLKVNPKTVSKWEATGLLQGLTGTKKEKMAQLL